MVYLKNMTDTHKHIKYMYTYIHIYINRENVSYNFFKSHLPNKCRTTAWQPDEPDDVLTMSRWDVQGELEPRAIPWSSLTNRTARSEIETLQKPQNFLTVGKHVMVYHGFPVFLTLMILGYSHDVFFLVWGVSANKTAQDSWTFQNCSKQPVHLVGR